MYEGFATYAVGGKVSSCKIEKPVTHFVMTCDDETYVSADKSVIYGKILRATITFILKFMGGKL